MSFWPCPPVVEIQAVPVLKALTRASRALADLKGQAKTIPDQGVLIDTLTLQAAKALPLRADRIRAVRHGRKPTDCRQVP